MSDAEHSREPAPDEAEADAPDTDAAPDDEASEAAPAEPEAPRKKKRKKKRKQPRRDDVPELRPARTADGRDRPAFLRAFPHDPELDRLIDAYEQGDYATVRRDAPELAEQTESEAVREAALELRRRIDPDPLMRYLLLTGVGLLVFLILWVYVGHR